MDWEIALTAWTNNVARIGYFERAMQAIASYVTSSRHTRRRILVCSEVLTPEYKAPFEKLCVEYDVDLHYHPEPPEVGRNHNFMRSLCEADYVLSTEDDGNVNLPLDVSDDIDFLESRCNFIMLRYALAPWGKMRPCKPPVKGVGVLDKALPYPYSNNAHLRHRARFEQLGPFVEDQGWGMQEIEMGERIRYSQWLIAGRAPNPFGHMGYFASEPERWPEGETP